jgi:ParB family transcriptional regulator, chromosome partitioning protein
MAESDEETRFELPQRLPRARGGLIALMREDPAPEDRASATVIDIPTDAIAPSQFQAREQADQARLEELASSIAKKGILQPLLVRPAGRDETGHEKYELVAGERRLRAAKLAGLSVVPAILRDLNDRESAEAGIIENAQREDLNPVEEAHAYKTLVDHFGMNQTEIAAAVCKNRVTISNALRLLQLPVEVLELLRTGALSAGHGRALLALKDHELLLSFAHKAVSQTMSVRALEELVARANAGPEDGEEEDESERRAVERLQARISEYLGVENVRVRLTGDGKKQLSVTFDSEAAWKRFVSKIRD